MRIGITTGSAVCEIRKCPDCISFRQKIVGNYSGSGIMIFTSDHAESSYYACRKNGTLNRLYYNSQRVSLTDYAAAVVVNGSPTDFNFLSHFHHALDKKIDEWSIYGIRVDPQYLELAYGSDEQGQPTEKIRVYDLPVQIDLHSLRNAKTNSVRVKKTGTEVHPSVHLSLWDPQDELIAWGDVWYDKDGQMYVERCYPIEGTAEELEQLATARCLRDEHGYYYREF